jgi:hypothetical protein
MEDIMSDNYWYDVSGNNHKGVLNYDYPSPGFVYEGQQKMPSRFINNGLMLANDNTVVVANSTDGLNLTNYYTIELLVKFSNISAANAEKLKTVISYNSVSYGINMAGC